VVSAVDPEGVELVVEDTGPTGGKGAAQIRAFMDPGSMGVEQVCAEWALELEIE
jgi:hypothetical protein